VTWAVVAIVWLAVLFCVGWTIYWGVLAARKKHWDWAVLLWLLALGLFQEVFIVPLARIYR
jgi:hypothetical protein